VFLIIYAVLFMQWKSNETSSRPPAEVAIIAPIYITTNSAFMLAEQTMKSVAAPFPIDKIAIVNRVRDNQTDQQWLANTFDLVLPSDENILARAWNIGIKLAFERGAKYALVINLDIIFHKICIETLISFAEHNRDAILWSATEWLELQTLYSAEFPHQGVIVDDAQFSCFLVDKRLFEEVGEFDEQFAPCYHEDTDMRYRIRLLGKTMMRTSAARYFHFDRVSMRSALAEHDTDQVFSLINSTDENLQRYVNKWGGKPGSETFKAPYQSQLVENT